jgi:hypothetical protein
VSLASSEIDLEALLKERMELDLVVDGLDEISLSRAAPLLNQLVLLTGNGNPTPPGCRFSCVPSMFDSLEVKVLYST